VKLLHLVGQFIGTTTHFAATKLHVSAHWWWFCCGPKHVAVLTAKWIVVLDGKSGYASLVHILGIPTDSVQYLVTCCSVICRTAHMREWIANWMEQMAFTRGRKNPETKTPLNVHDIKGLLTMFESTEVAAKFTLISVHVTRSEHRSYAYVNSLDSHPPNSAKGKKVLLSLSKP
jgi:hypothetical protein